MRAPLALALALALAAGACSSAAKKSPRWNEENLLWVERPDGTRKCSPNPPEELGSVGESLRDAGVEVTESMRVHDDSIQPEQCGQETGWMNAYRIPKDELGKARELGFRESKIPRVKGSKATISAPKPSP